MVDLRELRAELDKLDEALVRILAERMKLIPKVAEYKKANKIARYQPEREKEIIRVKRELAKKLALNPDLVETLYIEIIKEAHRLEQEIMGE